jgi:hypothetical protein
MVDWEEASGSGLGGDFWGNSCVYGVATKMGDGWTGVVPW